MKYADILTAELGAPTVGQPASNDGAATQTVPDSLQELWSDHGFASYRDGFYWTTNPSEFSSVPKMWPRLKGKVFVFGRDAFANLYLLRDKGVWQLNPHRDEIVQVAMNLDLFFAACIADDDFRRGYMWSDLFAEALPAHGGLQHDECYGFFPALAIGGSADVAHVKRVKMNEYLAMVSQM